VPGLRREEVAVLAGVSVPYYTRLERGDLAGASDSVLEALARALQLDDAERAHLFDLARAAQPVGQPPRRRPAKYRIRPSVQQVLDAMTGAGAHIGNDRLATPMRAAKSCAPSRGCANPVATTIPGT
jgi:transcriptional regulator with XRE-family HTH domain